MKINASKCCLPLKLSLFWKWNAIEYSFVGQNGIDKQIFLLLSFSMGVTFPNGFNFSSIFPWLCWNSVHFINSGTDDVLLFQSYLLFGTFQMVLNSLWHKMLFTWASHISPIILMSRVSPKPKYSRFIAKYTKINDTWPPLTKIFMKMSICRLKI